jgi:hypothetical protein
MAGLPLPELDRLFRQARRAGVLCRLAVHARGAGVVEELPESARDHLASALPVAAQHERVIRWEVGRIRRALRATGSPIILLKGAAYVMAELPPRLGRLVSDIDILVPKSKLAEVEQALLHAGWEAIKLDPYDQRYYRTWMHELPPLRHRDRLSVVDVHHSILPETARLKPDAAKLIAAARTIAEPELMVLSPPDMVLHGATHLFQDGDLAGGLRDLIDLDDLLRHFGASEAGFWNDLAPRARELDLQRPLFYALRFAKRLLGTPIPDEVEQAARVGQPSAPVLALMDALVRRALLRDLDQPAPRAAGGARWLLYVRSQWLRMPPALLGQHLARKALRRFTEVEGDQSAL